MDGNIIMIIGGWVFGILFLFLALVFTTAIISLFKKHEYEHYEPNVSVIIPCYNEEKNIEDCLEAVYAQDYPKEKMQVIVVNDGSTDNTSNILEQYKIKHNDLLIINGSHEGKSAALNLGSKQAKHEFLLTIDADTIIDKESLKKLIRPFINEEVGAVNGACIARNSNSMISIFQKIEYHYNNLIRKSFSVIFKNGVWFFGAFVCYRKSILEKVGYFKKATMAEDWDIAMEIYSAGYRILNVHNAIGYTIVPHTLKEFYKQRTRWWMGALQSLNKNKSLFSRKSSPSILFLFISQYWWSIFAVVSIPLIAYQVYYWLPSNTETPFMLFMYLFRWFTLTGPIYVLYKIPEWGISLYSIFGVLSGIISVFLIIKAIYMFKDKLRLKNALGIFLYFPYTIILNSIIVISLIKLVFLKKKYFIY